MTITCKNTHFPEMSEMSLAAKQKSLGMQIYYEILKTTLLKVSYLYFVQTLKKTGWSPHLFVPKSNLDS